MTTQIVEYSQTEAALADLRNRYKDVVFDVSTPAGMAVARKGRAEMRTLRTALESMRVEIKAPALERCRLIDAEAKRITVELLALETPIDVLIKNEEQRKERERAEKERLEQERIAKIQARITDLANSASRYVGRSSTDIAAALAIAEKYSVGDWAAEFVEQAERTHFEALSSLRELHSAALASEAEKERIKAEREELAKLKAEQAQRDRDEQARIAMQVRIQAEAEAHARAKIEAEERAARERIEAEERKARLAREEADRAARQAREAEEARLKAERDRIAEEQRTIDEAKRKEREAEEAKSRERQRIENEHLEALDMLAAFRRRFGHIPEFAAVVKAINKLVLPT